MERFVRLGINVCGIDANLPENEIAEQCIGHMYTFFESIGIPMHLRDVGIDESRLSEMAHHIALEGIGGPHMYVPLS